MTSPLAPGYTVQPARLEMAPDIHRLIAEVEMHEFGDATGFSLEEVESDIRSLDPERDTWVAVAPDGRLAGYGYLRDRQHVRLDLETYVHPDHEGKGIGTTIVRLAEERARQHIALAPPDAQVVLHNWIGAGNEAACDLLEREGFAPYRFFFRMEMTLDGEIPAPEWPENVNVRACEPGKDEEVFYRTLEETMADHWGFIPVSFDEWMERRTRAGFEPSLWFLAEEDGEPAGAATCSISEGIGWVDVLGVRAPWRKQGIGMALLRHAARAFAAGDVSRMALGVDAASPTGATRLYERAEMHIAQRHAVYGKVLRPGVAEAETGDDSPSGPSPADDGGPGLQV